MKQLCTRQLCLLERPFHSSVIPPGKSCSSFYINRFLLCTFIRHYDHHHWINQKHHQSNNYNSIVFNRYINWFLPVWGLIKVYSSRRMISFKLGRTLANDCIQINLARITSPVLYPRFLLENIQYTATASSLARYVVSRIYGGCSKAESESQCEETPKKQASTQQQWWG